jgi:pimeloyl-ACP methyl ester carboxylesterase
VVIYPEVFRRNVDRYEKFLGMSGTNDPESEMLTERLINTTGFSEVLPLIRCPTLIIATTMFVRPVESVRDLAQHIPKGSFMEINTGHLASYQSPELVLPVFQKFLRNVGG